MKKNLTLKDEKQMAYAKQYKGKTFKELEEMYSKISPKKGDSKSEQQILMRERFGTLLLPLANFGNKLQQEWAKGKIAKESERLIKFFVNKYYSEYMEEYGEDLIAEGFVAVAEHAYDYDPDMQASYSTYMTVYFNSRMYKFVMENDNHTTIHYGEKVKKVKRAIAYFDSNNINYSIEDLAAKTHMKIDAVKQALDLIDLNNPLYFDGNDGLILDTTPSVLPTPEEIAIKEERQKIVYEALNNLTESQRLAVMARFIPENIFDDYSDGKREPSYEKIGKVLGSTSSKARRLCTRGINELRHNKQIQNLSSTTLHEKNDKNIDKLQLTFVDKEESEAELFRSIDDDWFTDAM